MYFRTQRKPISDSRNPKRKSTTLPDQALTPKQIMERYLKNIPVNILQRDPVFMDQEEHDFEQLNRMDFDEKFAFAEEEGKKAERIKQQLIADQKAKEELETREAEERQELQEIRARKKKADIDDLDNTMSADTKLKPK